MESRRARRIARESKAVTWVGADGCPAGWFAAVMEDGALSGAVFDDIDALWAAHADAECIFVDVPIGISEAGRRACDEDAKRLLGARGSSVFFTPGRDVVEVYRRDGDYDEANEISREATDAGLSIQAWNIVPKIEELDSFLREDEGDGRLDTVLESHPECCFLSLNGQPLAYSKSSEVGLAQRRTLLDSAWSGIEGEPDAVYRDALDRYPRSDLARDDVLDATALALVAAKCEGEYVHLPDGSQTGVPGSEPGATGSEPGVPTDEAGLPMQIVYGGPRYPALFETYRDT